MAKARTSPNLAESLTVGEAAARLGVSRSTLRNWDKAGKVRPHRHPVNGYRLYRRADVDELLAKIRGAKG
jgi:MerR family transcriptional regulator, copper efflux regulator